MGISNHDNGPWLTICEIDGDWFQPQVTDNWSVVEAREAMNDDDSILVIPLRLVAEAPKLAKALLRIVSNTTAIGDHITIPHNTLEEAITALVGLRGCCPTDC